MFKSLGVMVITASLTLMGCQQEDPQQIAQIASVRPAKLVEAVASNNVSQRTFPGVIEAANQTQLSFRVSGQVQGLPVRAGQRIVKGQLLAQLNDTDYRNNLMQAQANYDLAKVQYEQISQLYAKNYSSKIELEQVSAQLKSSQAALQIAQENLGHTRLLAPMDGIIDRVKIEKYQLVSPQFSIIQLRTLDDFDVRFDVPETLLTQVKNIDNPQGICLSLRFSTHPKSTYPACYKENESTPDPMARTYSMVFSVAPIKDFTLLPGMSVDVKIDLAQVMIDDSSAGVLIPIEALFEKNGTTFVWLVDKEMRVHQTPVKTGKLMNYGVQILDGLVPGSLVVAAGVAYMQNDMQVRALQKERGL